MPTVTKPKVSGFCETERLVEAGNIRSTTDSVGWHAMCKLTECECPGHEGEGRCRECGAPIPIELEQCADSNECAVRIRHLLSLQARTKELASKKEEFKGQTNERKRVARAARAREGKCEHCGCPTKGGRFAMGHDAKLKSMLQQGAKAGAVMDAVELMVRGWPTTNAPPATLTKAHEARKDIDHKKSKDEWLAARVASRIGDS